MKFRIIVYKTRKFPSRYMLINALYKPQYFSSKTACAYDIQLLHGYPSHFIMLNIFGQSNYRTLYSRSVPLNSSMVALELLVMPSCFSTFFTVSITIRMSRKKLTCST